MEVQLRDLSSDYSVPKQSPTRPPKELAHSINEARDLERQGKLTEAQKKYSELFWNIDTNREVLRQDNHSNQSVVVQQYLCLQSTYGESTADFLYGQVLLAGDLRLSAPLKNYPRIDDGMRYLFNSSIANFQPAIDCLIDVYLRKIGDRFETLFNSQTLPLALDIFTQAAIQGNPAAHELLNKLFSKYEDTIINFLTSSFNQTCCTKTRDKVLELTQKLFQRAGELIESSSFLNSHKYIATTMYKIAAIGKGVHQKEAKFKLYEIYKSPLDFLMENKEATSWLNAAAQDGDARAIGILNEKFKDTIHLERSAKPLSINSDI